MSRRPCASPWRTAGRIAVALAVFATATATLTSAAVAQQLPAGVTRGASVEGITEYTLANGLRVLLFPDQSKPTVTVNITYLVGSRHEGYGETGMAHLLEHLVFKGTPKHPNIPQELTERGAFPNGTTWYDRTNYFETVPATDANLEWALDLEADRMVNSFIAKKDLDSEFTVVRNEFESGENSVFRVTMQRTMSAAFDWHNYGKSTIGSRADIENVPIERLQAFYRRYYQPDNAILAVAGKFDVGRTLALIATKYGAIPRPARSLERGNLLYDTYTRDPEQDGEREITVRRVGDEQALMALYKVPAGTHPDFAAVQVLTQVMTQTPGGRFHKALVEPGLAANAGGNAFQLREPGMVLGMALLRKEQPLGPARDALIGAMEGFAAAPPTEAELVQARTALLKNIELQLANTQSIALSISEWASMGDWRMLFITRDRIEQVTLADVKRVAAAYFKPENRTLGRFIPTATPDRAKIPVVAAESLAMVVTAYKGRAALADGEAFDPSPANLDARTRRTTLPGGFKVAMLEKRTRGGIVNARVTLRYGDQRSLHDRGDASRLVGSMLPRGTAKRTRQEI
jgi:zinc protease